MVWALAILCASAEPVSASEPVLPRTSSQLILVVADGADASTATLRRMTRDASGWHAAASPLPARVGVAGVAWGIGLHPAQTGLQKVEGDRRSPSGVFLLGDAYRDDSVQPLAVAWPLHTVGPRDLWVEDPASPHYNEHIVVAGDRALLPWENKARMALGDPYLALKVFVRHNAPLAGSVRPGAGSAIFLHSGAPQGEVATNGCTAIDRADLERLIAWLDPAAMPVFALLARADLSTLGPLWGLPQVR